MADFIVGCVMGFMLWILGSVAWMGAHNLASYSPPIWTFIIVPVVGLMWREMWL